MMMFPYWAVSLKYEILLTPALSKIKMQNNKNFFISMAKATGCMRWGRYQQKPGDNGLCNAYKTVCASFKLTQFIKIRILI